MSGTGGFGGQMAWNMLPFTFVSKDIPPGWGGPGTERTFKTWLEDLKRWRKLNSYDNNDARCSAVEFRVPDEIKRKITSFPPREPDAEGIFTHSQWEWLLHKLQIEYGEHLVQDEIDTTYQEYVDYRRARSDSLRKFLPEHRRRMDTATGDNDLDFGPRAKTFFFLRNAKLTPDQRRWILGARNVENDKSKFDEICKAALAMPDDLAL